MKQVIFFFPVLLLSCTSENDQDVLNRALNDEAMQALNIRFEEKNMDYYFEVDKMNAALMATKGELLDLVNYRRLDSVFSNCKHELDSIQNVLLCDFDLPFILPDVVFKTSEVKNLNDVIELDVSGLKKSVMTACISVKNLLANDTILHIFKGLDPSEFIDDKAISYASYAAEVEALIHQFDSSYANVNSKLPFIDILEFFTLARSTLILVERKSIRFHNLIVLTRRKFTMGKEINVAVKTDQDVYVPGEKMIIQPYLTIMHPSNHRKLIYTNDSLHFVSSPYSVKPKLDTIYLNTSLAGNHFVSVEYISGGKYPSVFRETYQYTVLPK